MTISIGYSLMPHDMKIILALVSTFSLKNFTFILVILQTSTTSLWMHYLASQKPQRRIVPLKKRINHRIFQTSPVSPFFDCITHKYRLIAEQQQQDDGLLETMQEQQQQFYYIQLGQHNVICYVKQENYPWKICLLQTLVHPIIN